MRARVLAAVAIARQPPPEVAEGAGARPGAAVRLERAEGRRAGSCLGSLRRTPGAGTPGAGRSRRCWPPRTPTPWRPARPRAPWPQWWSPRP